MIQFTGKVKTDFDHSTINYRNMFITVVESTEGPRELVEMTWKVTKLKEYALTIQINFTQPLEVSKGFKLDKLAIILMGVEKIIKP